MGCCSVLNVRTHLPLLSETAFREMPVPLQYLELRLQPKLEPTGTHSARLKSERLTWMFSVAFLSLKFHPQNDEQKGLLSKLLSSKKIASILG